MERKKQKEPKFLKTNYMLAGFCLLDKKPAISISASVITIREARRLHRWLTQAIAYLEQEKSDE